MSEKKEIEESVRLSALSRFPMNLAVLQIQ